MLRTGLFLRNMSKKSKKPSSKTDPKAEPLKTQDESIFLNKSNRIIINILAKPGAKQNAITDFTSEGVGVQINAPPSEGEANTELVKYIASVLKIRKSDVVFDRGFKSRNKTLKITDENLSVDDVRRLLTEEITDKN